MLYIILHEFIATHDPQMRIVQFCVLSSTFHRCKGLCAHRLMYMLVMARHAVCYFVTLLMCFIQAQHLFTKYAVVF